MKDCISVELKRSMVVHFPLMELKIRSQEIVLHTSTKLSLGFVISQLFMMHIMFKNP
jgi:hypothetical protein